MRLGYGYPLSALFSGFAVIFAAYNARATADGAVADSNPCAFRIFVDILNRTS